MGRIMETIGEFENMDNALRMAEFLRWNDLSVLTLRRIGHEMQNSRAGKF